MGTLPPSLTLASPEYPVQVTFDPQRGASRFWAIPVLGFLVKGIILIPHYFALMILGMVVGVLQLVLWIPVLTAGRYPEWAFGLVSGTLRWGIRVQSYWLGLTDQYPPFGPGGAGTDTYPVRVTFQRQQSYNRGWAIPVVGLFVKMILIIPHSIILYALGIVVGCLQLVLWVPVLFTGSYPSWGYQLVGGYVRWTLRTAAYIYGLADAYPPFQMG